MATMAGTLLTPWNWPMWWRILILLNISFFNMMGNVFVAGISPLFGLLIAEFHCTPDEVSRLASYTMLMLGLGNLMALPAVEYLGKRYTIILSMFVFLVSNIWAAKAQSYNSLLGSRLLGGIPGGVVEALGPFIVSDCFHEHQLGGAMVVYVAFLAAGSAVGPIVAGAVASGLNNWRWFFSVTSISIGIIIITCILMLPETTHVIEDYELDTSTSPSDVEAEKKPAENIEDAPEAGEALQSQSLKTLWLERSFYTRLIYVKKRENPIKIFLALFSLFLAPPVLLTTVVFGLSIGWTAQVAIVVANVYSAPPKLWKAYQVGLLHFGPLIGLLIGFPVGGGAADFLSKRAMKRSGGEHDPRVRLPALILGGLISPAGCVLIGFVLKKDLHYIWLSVGWGMLAFGMTASANVILTYAIDCFRLHAGHVGVLVNIIKNSVAFGIAYASMTWFTEVGPARQFGTMAGLSWGTYLLVIPLYIWSRGLVRWSEKTLRL